MIRHIFLFIPCLLISILGCTFSTPDSDRTLRIATTTSTRDSGLMDILIPEFEEQQNVRVKLIAVGTGKALELGRQGEVDALLVHSEKLELDFMRHKHGMRRTPVMFNYFELLGPRNDPAGIKGQNVVEALHRIRQTRSAFVSRGDNSGTHHRECELWKSLESVPRWGQFMETGQGMGASLMVADQKEAYILCDRGTYLAMKNKIDLVPLCLRSQELVNPYSVIVVAANRHEPWRSDLADRFAEFMVSNLTQIQIEAFQVDGEALFHPLRRKHKTIDNKFSPH